MLRLGIVSEGRMAVEGKAFLLSPYSDACLAAKTKTRRGWGANVGDVLAGQNNLRSPFDSFVEDEVAQGRLSVATATSG